MGILTHNLKYVKITYISIIWVKIYTDFANLMLISLTFFDFFSKDIKKNALDVISAYRQQTFANLDVLTHFILNSSDFIRLWKWNKNYYICG